MPVKLDIKHQCESPCQVELSGDIDIYSAPRLRDDLFGCLGQCDQRCEVFRVDISQVDFVDSAGFSLFIGLWRHCQELGHRLTVVGANSHIRRIFKITGLDFMLGD